MPILDIVDETGRLVQLAPIITAAVMFFPRDANRREELFATGYVHTAIKVNAPTPSEIASVTYRGPGTENLFKAAELAAYQGSVAGNMLFFILRAAAHKPEHATVRKAVYWAEKNLALQAGSVSTIRKAWSYYKPGAHLWAAWEILGRPEDCLNTENLQKFISFSEWLREKAEAHYPPPRTNRSKPLVEPNEAWAAPSGMDIRPVCGEFPQLLKKELDWLEKYQAV